MSLSQLRLLSVCAMLGVGPGSRKTVIPAPGSARGVLFDVGGAVLQALEEFLPLGVDRIGVLFELGVEIVDIGGVGALQKRGKGKSGVRVLTRHDGVLVIFHFAHGIRRGGRLVTDRRVEKTITPFASNVRAEKNQAANFSSKL